MSQPPSNKNRLNQLIRAAVLGSSAFSLVIMPTQAIIAETLAEQQVIVFDVPAGSLTQSLNQIALIAGVNLSWSPDLTRAHSAAAISGRYTVEEALELVLRETDLLAQATGSGYTLVSRSNAVQDVAAPAEQTEQSLSLGRMEVSSMGLGAMTEGTGSYTTGRVNSSTRLGLSLRETPQTITVITSQQIKDFGYDTMDDVLKATSGTYVYNRGANGGAYFSRGFAMQSQYDGIPNPWGISEQNRNPSPDSAILDHVEVVQGASGLLTGAGDPGGTINMVRKMPTHTPQAAFEVSLGSWNYRRAMADVSGPLIESGRIRGRAVAAVQREKSFVDHEFSNRRVFYGVLETDLTDTTLVSANVQIQHNRYNDDFGVQLGPSGEDLGFGRSSFFGADWGNMEKENRLYTLRLDQQLPHDWQLRAAFNRSETDVNNKIAFPMGSVDVDTGAGMTIRRNRLQREFFSNAFDVYASGPVMLLGREHELVLGGNSAIQTDRSRNNFSNVPIDNLYQFDPRAVPYLDDDTLTEWPSFSRTRQRGVYSAARINIADPLKLIVGGRLSWFESGTARENRVWSPYAGLIYDLNDWASVYASYSDIFNPQSNKSASGNNLDPVVGKNYEVGLKGEFFEGRLNTGLALFRLEQTNLAKLDESVPYDQNNACEGWCYTASDKVLSRGVDFSVAGAVTEDWQMMAGYSYVHSKYASGDQSGDAYNTYMPQHIFRMSTIYQIPASQWSVGGDVQYHSRIYQKTDVYHIRQGGVGLVGLLAKYQLTEQSEIKLSVQNLFDRKYFESISTPNYFNSYGAPRSAYITYQLNI